MSGKNNGKKLGKRALYKAIADVIIRHGEEGEPLTLPLTIGGQTVDEKTVVDAVITHWREIALGLGIRVYANPIAIEAEEGIGSWIIKVYLPYLYLVEIEIGNGLSPKAWIMIHEDRFECASE